MGTGTECPQCGGDNVELDSVQALSFCLDCGFVLTEGDLDISVLFDASTGGPSGIILAKDDDGSRAASIGLPQGVKRSGPKGERYGQAKAQARTKALCAQLGLSSAATASAVSITEQLLSELYKRQRSCGQPLRGANRDKTAAAAVYIAARMAQMPLTVVTVAAAIRTSTKTFGRAYQSAVAALGIRVPAVPPQVFLQFGAQSLCRDPSAQTCVERDAVALESWLSAQPGHQGTPLLVSAASLTIALEAHTLQPRARDVSKLLTVSDTYLARYTTNAKSKLVDAAKALPWADKISTRNVAVHLPTILKLIGLKTESAAAR
jgi:transcription initiation factor TFIIIB Brf1 subunit/transcription initiation factor TFIIB